MASAAELRFTLEGVAAGMREDGRELLDWRHVSMEVDLLPHASGSCRLISGCSEILVGVSATLSKPDADLPDMGRIAVSVGGGPGEAVYNGLPDYDALAQGAVEPDAKRLWLESALSKLYGPSVTPTALRALCIVPGAQCWELKAHVQLLRADGCPLDAAAIALRAALHTTRVPRVAVAEAAGGDGDGGDGGAAATGARLEVEIEETLEECTPFDASAVPLYVTLASLDGQLVADCTAKERCAAACALSLGLTADGTIAALNGGGSFGMHVSLLAAAIAAARQLGAALHAAAAEAIRQAEEAAERRGGPAACEGVGFALH